jgi:hypothetical protein
MSRCSLRYALKTPRLSTIRFIHLLSLPTGRQAQRKNSRLSDPFPHSRPAYERYKKIKNPLRVFLFSLLRVLDFVRTAYPA